MSNTDYTVTALLASLKRRGMLPSTSEALSDSDYFAFCDEELRTYVVPEMMSVMEEYFVFQKDYTISNNQANYAIPTRAMGGTLRNVFINVTNSNQSVYVPLPRIEPEIAAAYGWANGGPIGYKLQNNTVVLVPIPSSNAGSLRLQYFMRPNTLVPVTSVGTITNIAGNVFTCSTVPTTFTASQTFDLVKANPGFDTTDYDLAASAVVTGASGTVTFTTTPSTDIAVGDYVCLSTQSPVAQIPYELHALLAQRTAAKAQEALGDPRAPLAMKVCDAMAQKIMRVISPRTQGSARYIINKNGPGGIYRNWGFGRWGV